MPNRNAKFVSAVFAGVLAGSNFIPALNDSAHAEDTCLAAPNAQTPHGSHWYYRIEHGTKRHCWYLREEGDAHSQSAAATSSPAPASPPPAPAKPAPAQADTAMQGSVANARAELPWPQPRTAPATPAPATPAPAPAAALAPAPAAAMAAPALAAAPVAPTGQLPAVAAPTGQLPPPPAVANAPDGDNTPPSISTAATGNADTSQTGDMSQTTIASRWPDQLNANTSDDSAPAADNSSTNPQPDATTAPPPSAVAPVPPTAADAPPPASKQPGSMQGLLTIMIAALALAGLVGGAIMRFGRRKGAEDEAELDLDRRPVWDREYDDHPLPYPAAAAHRPNIGRPRELRTVEPDDTIKEMLARLARSAQT